MPCVMLTMMLGRWRKQTAAARGNEAKPGAGARDQWDEKLDAELKELDRE